MEIGDAMRHISDFCGLEGTYRLINEPAPLKFASEIFGVHQLLFDPALSRVARPPIEKFRFVLSLQWVTPTTIVRLIPVLRPPKTAEDQALVRRGIPAFELQWEVSIGLFDEGAINNLISRFGKWASHSFTSASRTLRGEGSWAKSVLVRATNPCLVEATSEALKKWKVFRPIFQNFVLSMLARNEHHPKCSLVEPGIKEVSKSLFWSNSLLHEAVQTVYPHAIPCGFNLGGNFWDEQRVIKPLLADYLEGEQRPNEHTLKEFQLSVGVVPNIKYAPRAISWKIPDFYGNCWAQLQLVSFVAGELKGLEMVWRFVPTDSLNEAISNAAESGISSSALFGIFVSGTKGSAPRNTDLLDHPIASSLFCLNGWNSMGYDEHPNVFMEMNKNLTVYGTAFSSALLNSIHAIDQTIDLLEDSVNREEVLKKKKSVLG
jgi:hypothetical protein